MTKGVKFMNRLHQSTASFQLLETLLLHQGEYHLLDYHLNRLNKSATYFNIKINKTNIYESLMNYAENHRDSQRKVRLLLDGRGEITMESEPLIDLGSKKRPVIVATEPINRTDLFHYHKTTNRTIYEKHRRLLTDAYFDVLMWNEKQEITEFSIGNIVLEKDGQKYTPPVHCGLLPGTFREHLLGTGEISERIVMRHELDLFSNVWLINSVRGWVPVTIME